MSMCHATRDVTLFEDAFRDAYGVGYCLSLCSGTAAYLAALLALELPPESELIMSAYGWPQLMAVPAAIGLRTKLVDCDAAGRICPQAVEAAVGPRTRAIVACHLFGNPVDVRRLAVVAARHSLRLIEDCSQALLAAQQGRYVGHWGDIGFASLGPGKMLSAEGGGVLFTHRLDYYRRAAHVSQHPARWGADSADATPLWRSLSIQMHPAAARLALRDLEDWPTRAVYVSSLHRWMRQALAEEPLVRLPEVLLDASPMWQHCPILLEHPGVVEALDDILWTRRPAYLLDEASAGWPQAAKFAQQAVFLHTGRKWGKLRTLDVETLAQEIRRAFQAVDS